MASEQIDAIIRKLTDNQRTSLELSISDPGPGETLRISTGLGKWTYMSFKSVLGGLLKRGLAEPYKPRPEELPPNWGYHTAHRLTDLGREVAERLSRQKQ